MSKESPESFDPPLVKAIKDQLETEKDGRIRELEEQLKEEREGHVGIISRLADRLSEQNRMAVKDDLTQLPNRRGFFELAKKMIARGHADAEERGEKREVAPTKPHESFLVIMLDVDHFKDINDTYGHDIGDVALKEVSRYLESQFREEDLVGRYGGEEFVMLLPDADAEGIKKKLEGHTIEIELPGDDGPPKRVPITFSAGISAMKSGESLEVAISIADEGLYKSKQAGRNRITIS